VPEDDVRRAVLAEEGPVLGVVRAALEDDARAAEVRAA
jgi:hypothetical protein